MDNTNPVVLLNLRVQQPPELPMLPVQQQPVLPVHEEAWLSTSLAIFKSNVYCYSFIADQQWRVVNGAPYTHVHGTAEICSIPFQYSGFITRGGPRVIYSAMANLRSRDTSRWRDAYHSLCQIFLESVRSNEVRDLVRASLIAGQDSRFQCSVQLDARFSLLIHSWGELSDILHDGRAAIEAVVAAINARDADARLPLVMTKLGFHSFDDVIASIGVVMHRRNF